MRTPLDDVEFLARSDHRVTILETLTREGLTPNELQEETGISRATIGRVLGNFEERGWVKRSGRVYARTAFGDLLAEEFADLLDTVETIQRMQEIARWLPPDELDIDLRAFREATITTSRSPDVFAHIRRGDELVQDATRIRWLTGNILLEAITKQRELILEQDQTYEVIISKDAFDIALSHPDTVAVIRELLGTDNLTVYQYTGEVSIALGIIDDIATIVPYDEQNVPCALIDTESESIRSWVSDTMDGYRDRSELITVADIPK